GSIGQCKKFQRFTVSVKYRAPEKAIFYLNYEELLVRQNENIQSLSTYTQASRSKKLDVGVHIDESRPIKFVRAPPLRTGNEICKKDGKLNPNAEITTVNETSALVKFSPDVEKQKQYAIDLGTDGENGLAGQFVVEYDVERDLRGGEVLVDVGYFVHFFAPSVIHPLPKQVVFILDTSGSMKGIRITQLKEAMRSILPELRKDDIFNIVEFNTIVKVWNVDKVAVQYESGIDTLRIEPEDPKAIFQHKTEQPIPPAYPATEENIQKAEQIVEKLSAFGATDIQSALKVGIQIVEKNHKEDKKHQPIIIFLTDGEATIGETDNNRIIRTITDLNSGKAPIFSLSFGDGPDRSFLQKLSLKNLAFSKHIYEAADASLQLQQFYKEISSPLLANVTFKYVNVSEVTKTYFPILFGGSEIVVSGQIDSGFYPPSVEGWGINGPIKLTPVVQNSVGSLERLWAHLTLQQILQQRYAADNKTGPTQEALRIALKYSFLILKMLLIINVYQHAQEQEINNLSAALPGAAVHISEEDRYDNHEDRVAHPTWASLLPRPSTTNTPSTEVHSSELQLLKTALPWLSNVLNEDGALNLTSGIFSLGLSETILEKPECPKSPLNLPGVCTLIHKCPQVYTHLTDLESYKKYFCDLKGFAGVCCTNEDLT
ncbi:Inter-alpha-trypsin inhibitor heavy chain H4, partial [Gonioctena quinquepunctata]